MKRLKLSGMIFLLLAGSGASCQFIQEHIRQALKATGQTAISPCLEEFYRVNEYRLIWIGNKDRTDGFLRELQTAPDYGLEVKDYQPEVLVHYRSAAFVFRDLNDSVGFDLEFSKAAIHFFCDVKNGSKRPQLRYNGLSYEPDCSQIPSMLKKHLEGNSLQALATQLTPNTPEYNETRQKLAYFNRMISDSSFREVTITSGKVSQENKPLLVKLYQLGILESFQKPVSISQLKISLKAAQKMLDVLSDGILGKISLTALNVPLVTRRNDLRLLLNYLRWLNPYINNSEAGLLNIPSASLLVYQKGNLALETRIIAGKPSTPTPTLSSRITEVILYPYWMVPRGIAVKELLPEIQKNRGYLAANKYQVLNKQGKVIDPSMVNWNALSASHFPYIIRQSTGCDNALGLIKFNFHNPFTVYWHDTPAKSLFYSNRRFFSHGCMRVEKAGELAHLILKDNRIAIDTLTEKGCLRQQAPVVVPAEVKMPVMIIYSTVWYDKNGTIRFYRDVYKRRWR